MWQHVLWKKLRNLVLLAKAVKNYRSVSLLACKQSLLVLNSNGKAKARVARGQVTSTWVARSQLARFPLSPVWQKEPRGPRVKQSESFILRTYKVGRVGVKKLYFHWPVKVVPAFPPGEIWLPKHRYGGLLELILILLHTLFVYFAYVTEGRQLIKVVTWAFLWAL